MEVTSVFGLDWEHAPPAIRHQVERLRDSLGRAIGDNLFGLYLHGSLALGDFVSDQSDIDLLAVLHAPMIAEVKWEVAGVLLIVSSDPRPIEITFTTEAALSSLRFPLAYDFHYSEDWRERMQADLVTGAWRAWNEGERHDEDLSGQVAITRRHGIRLHGEDVEDTLPVIPDEEIAACFVREGLWALDNWGEIPETCLSEPVPVYGILNSCRTLCYLHTGRMCSKGEAGRWALTKLPTEHARVVKAALDVRYVTGRADTLANADLRAFAAFMRQTIPNPETL